jgi:chemotaxis protein methyltransferase CheR
MNDQEYSYLRDKLFECTKLDINCYKTQQMRRRLDAFVAKYNYQSIPAYCEILKNNKDKQRELLDFMAINVTEFFRDARPFERLQKEVIPQLLAASPRLNIWSAACSGGHEPYSLAMILEETSSRYHHRILATDIDESALEWARNGGPYTLADVKNIPKNILEKYLYRNETGYWIDSNIKKKIIFQRQNLLYDSFEGNFDLIVCRNVIIYFSEPVRNMLYKRFHASLKPGGVMFLGGSEVMLSPNEFGYTMLFPSFYRKAVNTAGKTTSVSTLSEALK